MSEHIDSLRHQGMRKQLVEILRQKGIADERVLNAIGKIPRHLFGFAPEFAHRAYEDTAFPIAAGQTISQPYTVAYMTELLELKGGEKILEAGTGSGYQAAVLATMGMKVFTIERQKDLFDITTPLLKKLGFDSIQTFYGDGYEGLPDEAPFDGIIVTAGAAAFPEKLQSQVRTGGKIVVPIGNETMQTMFCLTKMEDESFRQEALDVFRFVPFVKGKN